MSSNHLAMARTEGVLMTLIKPSRGSLGVGLGCSCYTTIRVDNY